MRVMLGCCLLLLASCGDKEETLTGACELAAETESCPECYSGEVTCTYDDVSETAGSCGDCQALSALYQNLCDAGNEDSRDDIEAGTVCSGGDTE